MDHHPSLPGKENGHIVTRGVYWQESDDTIHRHIWFQFQRVFTDYREQNQVDVDTEIVVFE